MARFFNRLSAFDNVLVSATAVMSGTEGWLRRFGREGDLNDSAHQALALVGLGFRSMSLTPSSLGAVKAMLLDLDAGKAEALIRPMVENPPVGTTIRAKLEEFAVAEGLQL